MPEIRDLTDALRSAATSGGNRVSIGPNPTFGSRTAPVLLPGLFPQLEAEALSFSSVDVATSGSAAVVAPGAPKPAVASVTITPRQLGKIAGTASLNAEAAWESPGVLESVIFTLLGSCLVAEDAQANGILDAATADAVPAADWISAIAGGQAAVAGAGGAPSLVVLPAAAWPALAVEVAGSAGLSTPSSDAIMSVLGSRIVISPSGSKAFVLDPSAAVHVVRDTGFIVDALSQSTSNVVRVVVDLVSGVFVGVPSHVAEIAVTITP